MEVEYSFDPPCSREEEDELGRSVKRFKENSGVRLAFQPRVPVSYKDTLLGEIPGAYEQAFKFDTVRDDEKEAEPDLEPLIEGMVDVNISRELCHVSGNLGLREGLFLIRFNCVDDFEKVLKGRPWFIGGHFLAIRPWEPYFKASEAKLNFVAVWIRFPELPIEFYDRDVLKEIGSAIGPMLRIDSYTASGSKGSYARLCVQVDLDKPLINMVRIGKCRQAVLYEGISALCFSCGRLGHTQDKCCYSIKKDKKKDEDSAADKSQDSQSESQLSPNYGPWMLVIRKRNLVRNGRGFTTGENNVGIEGHKGKSKVQLVEDDVTSKSSFEALDEISTETARVEINSQDQKRIMSMTEQDMVSVQACQASSLGEAQNINLEVPIKKVSQSANSRSAKILGTKNPKTLKRQGAQTGHKNLNNQASPSSVKSQTKAHGNKLPRIVASASIWLGNVAQEQSGGADRRNNCSDTSCSNGNFGVVLCNAMQCLEESLSHNSLEYQNRGSSSGATGMVLNSQSLLEVHHRQSPSVVGRGRDFKQAEEAISRASLRRIRVGYPRTKDSGLQGVGFISHGEPPYVEADSNPSPSQELRPIDMLQRGYNGDPQVFDGMETRVEVIQGSFEETRLVYGGGCNDAS
nr:hypothetical protein CFP56_55570 [Quercus suber]